MMALHRHQPDAAVRSRLIDATIPIVALHGVRAVDSATVCHAAMLEVSAVSRYFGSTDRLLRSTVQSVARRPVLPLPAQDDPSRTAEEMLTFLALTHRRYVARSPVRFAAILQFSSATLFGWYALRPPLSVRHARSRTTAKDHFIPFDRSGDPEHQSFDALADAFVNALTGIEMCHVIDGDPTVRDASYAGLVTAFGPRLGGTLPRRAGRPPEPH